MNVKEVERACVEHVDHHARYVLRRDFIEDTLLLGKQLDETMDLWMPP